LDGPLALKRPARLLTAASAQAAKRIERLDPALDAIIDP
jgi:hypothetical protein